MKLIRLLKHDLSSEAARWCELGLIEREQARSILDLYGTELPNGERKNFGYYALMAFAALFAGVGLIIFLSHNWAAIPRFIRFIGLLGITIAVNAQGVRYLSENKIKPARISFFLGSICYGATIFLIGQMYHLGEHFSNGFLLWAAGILPLGLLTGSVLLMLLSALVSTIWFFIEIGFQNMPWSYGFLSVALFYFALVRRRSVLLFLTAVVTALTYAETLLGYIIGGSKQVVTIDSIHLFFTVAAFLVLNTIATLLTEREHQTRLADYGIALKAWVARFGAVTLLILSFEGSWKELIREANSDAGMILGTVAVYALVHGAGLFFLWRRELGDKTRFFWNHFSSIALGVCFVLLSLLVCVVPRDTAILLVVVSNLAVMGTGIWLILAAVRNGTQSRFYLGVLLLICLALIRYFDLFGGYIGGAAAFFIAGAMLFASARYWRRSSTHTSNTGVLA